MRQDTTTGDLHGSEVTYSIAISSNGGAYGQDTSVTISGKTTSKYQKSTVVPLPKGANSISVRVTRITADSTSAALNNEIWLDSYAEIIESKLSYPNSAIVGVRIDASQFSSIPTRSYLVDGLYIQVPSNYDAVEKTYSGIWNGTFKPAISSNPAWILYDILTNKRYGLGGFISEDQIDRAMLYQLGKYCDERVSDGYGSTEPRFAINTAIQSTAEAYRLIGDISSAFRGMTYWNGSQVSFTQDAPLDPTMIYSPANVVGGEFNYSGSARKDRHSVVHVTWNDPADKFRKQIEYVEDPELVRQLGVRKAEVIAFGCTSRGQANRAGRWVLYSERYESNIITFTVGIDSALAAPGDIIRIQDPTRAGKRMAGRIVSSTPNTVGLDAPITISDSVPSISIRLPDGSFFDSEVLMSAGVYSELLLSKRFDAQPMPGAMFIVIEQNLKPLLAKVLSIAPQNDGTYQISAVEHNPAKYASIDHNLSLEVPKTSTVKLIPATPSALQIKETQYAVAPGLLGNKLHISWFGNSPKYELRWRIANTASGNWTEVVLTKPVYEIENVDIGGLELEIVGINDLYRSGILKYSYSVQGKVTPSEPLKAFYATGEAMQIRLNWTYSPTAQSAEAIEIWSNSATNDVSLATRIAVLPWPQDQFVDTGKSIGVRIYYFARTKDRSGNYSSWSSATGESISDPSLLMEQLTRSIGLDQIVAELKAPIEQVIAPENLRFSTSALNEMITDAANVASEAATAAAEARAQASSMSGSVNAAVAAVASIQELGLDRIDVAAVKNAVDATEKSALGVIRGILDNETTFRRVNGNLMPRIATAEQTIEKTVTDLGAEVTAREAFAVQVGNNIAAINNDIQVRASETETLARQVQTMTVTLNDTVVSTISQERSTRASETEALSKKIDGMSASVVPEIQSRLLEESTARATADTAITGKLTLLESKVTNDISAAILREESARTTQDSALANSITELRAGLGINSAAITAEQQARADKDSALATQITTLRAKVDNDIAASIAQESSARATQDSALATQITQLQAKVNNDITASIASEATARANADSAQATKLAAIEAKTNANEAAIKSEETARTTADSATATKLNSLETKIGTDIAAAIKTEETARAAQDSALATKITSLETKTGANEAAIKAEETARTTADSATATRLNSLETKTGENEAAIKAEETARTTAVSGVAGTVTTITARLDTGDFALVKSRANASVDAAGARAQAETVLATSLASGQLAAIKNTAETATTPAEATAAAKTAITAALEDGGALASIKEKALASVDALGAQAEAGKYLSSQLATPGSPLAQIQSKANTAVTAQGARSEAGLAIEAQFATPGSRLATLKQTAESSVSESRAETIFSNKLTAAMGDGGALAGVISKANASVDATGAYTQATQAINASLKEGGSLAGIKISAETAVATANSASSTASTALGTANTAIGYSSKYVIQAQADGSYAAMQIAAASGIMGSAVTFTADKFMIALPDDVNGTKKPAFVAGTLNGTYGVGINGSLIVDGSISARKIYADSLSALTANIGLLRTATSGPRMEISSSTIKVFDDAGLRVLIGQL